MTATAGSYHITPLGSSICVLCGTDVYAEKQRLFEEQQRERREARKRKRKRKAR